MQEDASVPTNLRNLAHGLNHACLIVGSHDRDQPRLSPDRAGELIEKIVSLQIKNERLTDAAQRANTHTELAKLEAARDRALAPSPELAALTVDLRALTLALWQLQDNLQRCEQDRDFGPREIAMVVPPTEIHSFIALEDRTFALTVVGGEYKPLRHYYQVEEKTYMVRLAL